MVPSRTVSRWIRPAFAALDIVDVGHAYAPGAQEDRWALKPLKLTFESGKTFALVGPSGCGKTTLLNILSGLVRPSRGRVLFEASTSPPCPPRPATSPRSSSSPSSTSR
ncbi:MULTISPECIES: ATP-binding cassette domain-containing protein [Streptomyces]|uniref:ATP-binding cassette domain-containing protein n=1 Tax=Streptomyces TaxID=1883 RepID=UPI0028AE64B9|nr:ATP-binding cassette domain-containing protein [Streptomyces sp. WAC 01325]